MNAIDLTVFDRTTSVTVDARDPLVVHASLDDSWSSLRGVHGGYLTAIAVRAAESQLVDRVVRSVTTTFLRPAAIGPARLSIAPVREGRNLTTLAVTIEQEGTVASVRITAGKEEVGGASWEHTRFLDLYPIEACVPLYPPATARHFEQADALLDPRGVPFSHGEVERLGGYVRPRERRPIDAAWLAMIADWFPPCSFVVHDPPTGGVSVDYSVHIHATRGALGPDEWLAAKFEAPVSRSGLALEHGIVVGPDGSALVESFHTRWTA
ncbi:MAG TPA: thioesterase family protein [Acidimicrobiales bacterium]|nr:thioesterase family protein [Acidimicrobiales bacterium]